MVGASGFVGSAVVSALDAAGIGVVRIAAPRLATDLADPARLTEEAQTHPCIPDLAEALSGCSVVVNAAGLAAPGASDTPELRGANALLPAVLAEAAARAGAHRFIHLSSAAVQGRSPVLDDTEATTPFSAYSRSKALGEQTLRAWRRSGAGTAAGTGLLPITVLPITVVRATSVQGPTRPTTLALARLARSPLASVASPGNAPTPVVSVDALAGLVLAVGRSVPDPPFIVLQPWGGLTVTTVLEAAGGRPLQLPRWVCRAIVRCGYAASSLAGGRLSGAVRRVELMWFGQAQRPGWAEEQFVAPQRRVRAVLEAAAGQAARGRKP
ncbi:NAD-dependent epimerase/dehydratase family protein [Arthrobacter sp. Br18]|uniref:NAD-dependent epimerase/dehydratase family protein n=1 Tax=Arthrobacter sp. Br18 TaxID=1312954 RepID=UPI0004AD0F82|nr:NAD-dependent epimerase/dehydratase family protein [Arthrobacter sp. Br18]